MKSFRQVIAEVAQPNSPEEKAFKDQHTYEVAPHPVALDAQFTGDIAPVEGDGSPKAARPADQKGSANYDLAYPYGMNAAIDGAFAEALVVKTEALVGGQKELDHDKDGDIDGDDFAKLRAKKKKKNESVEELEEYSNWKIQHPTKSTKSYTVKARNTGEAIKKGHAAAKKAGDMHPASDNRMFKPKHIQKEDLDETTMSALKKGVTTTGTDGKTRTVFKTTKDNKTDERGQDKITTNEGTESLDEAFAQGILKFKDGKQMILKKEDANVLNKMFKKMSSGSVKKMTETAMKDKAGFAEILEFAKEAM